MAANLFRRLFPHKTTKIAVGFVRIVASQNGSIGASLAADVASRDLVLAGPIPKDIRPMDLAHMALKNACRRILLSGDVHVYRNALSADGLSIYVLYKTCARLLVTTGAINEASLNEEAMELTEQMKRLG